MQQQNNIVHDQSRSHASQNLQDKVPQTTAVPSRSEKKETLLKGYIIIAASVFVATCLLVFSPYLFSSLEERETPLDEALGKSQNGIVYTFQDGVLTITGNGPMTDMSWRENLKKQGIDESLIESVVIETGVTSIGDSAFENYKNLSSITVPDTVTSIGSSAFSGCSSLTGISIDSVISIGYGAFAECTSLTSISIPDSAISIGNAAFRGCGNVTIHASEGSSGQAYAEEYNIPFVPTSELDSTSQTATNFILSEVMTWTDLSDLFINERWYAVGLKKDGSVVSIGIDIDDSYFPVSWSDISQELTSWHDIVQLSANEEYVLGIKADGEVLLAGDTTSSWGSLYVPPSCPGVKYVAATSMGPVLITVDGEFLYDGFGDYNPVVWENEGNPYSYDIGPEGPIYPDTSRWRGLKKIVNSFGGYVALRDDGEMLINGMGRLLFSYEDLQTDGIVDIAGKSNVVELLNTGAVRVVGENDYGQCDTSSWTDIIKIACGSCHTVGLKSDGTVLAVGKNDFGQCAVSEWRDIVSVFAGNDCTLGLTASGTLLYAGPTE